MYGKLPIETVELIQREVMDLKAPDDPTPFVEFSTDTQRWKIGGIDLERCLEAVEERSRRGYHYAPNGRVRLVYRALYRRDCPAKQFVQLKTGGHNYALIAATLLDDYRVRLRQAQVDRRHAGNEPTRVRVLEDAGVRADYSVVRTTSNPDRPVRVSVSISREMTAEAATELLRSLVKVGILS